MRLKQNESFFSLLRSIRSSPSLSVSTSCHLSFFSFESFPLVNPCEVSQRHPVEETEEAQS